MAKVLSKTGVQTGQTIQAFHISQSVDAFTGLSAYNITISGGLAVNGYSFPTADGIADQVMATDGSGNLTFQTLPLAATASFITSSGVHGPYGGDSITTASYAVSASHVEFADLASASYHAVNASDANTATSASYARTASVVTDSNVAFLDQNNTFTGTNQTFTNIIVNGTGSFSYFESVTGSAKIIGDAYIILNNNTPAERYAGVVVQDSGSAGVTASLEFDGQTNDWFYEYSDDGGATTDHGVVLFGPEYNTKGSPTYPTSNRLVKGNGDHHIVDSSITDNGTTVSTSLPFTSTQITASSGFKGNLVGNVTGTATTASYVEGSNVDGTVASATSASYAVSASHVEFADISRTSTSASYAVSASHVEFSDNSRDSVSSSFALTASYALNVDPTDTGSLLTTASAAANIITFTKGDSSTFEVTIATGSAESASFATSASHAEFSDNSRDSVSSSFSTTASYAISASHVEFADNSRDSVTSSFALTASYALNSALSTGSFIITASDAGGGIIQFSKGDGSTFIVQVDTGSADSASFATSASHAEFSDNSATATTASYALTASLLLGSIESASFATTASYAFSSSHEIIKEVSSSFADTASFALTASYALNAASVASSGITGAYTASFTDFTSGSFTHDLNTRNIVVAVYDTNYTEIIPETVTLSNLNTVFLEFGVSSSGHLVVTKVGGASPNTYKTTISGNTSYTINHNLAEDYPLVQVYQSGSKRQVVPEDIISLNSSSVQIDFNVNFDGNVIIKK
jgi:hypothetical protein